MALTMNFVFVPFFFPCIFELITISFPKNRLKVQRPPCRPGLEAKAEAWKVPSMPIQIEDKQAVEAAHAAATASCPKKTEFFFFFFFGLKDEFPIPIICFLL